ncbi:MAG: LPS assembly protein LptD [Proteobacteria bacterium]|nr:LPS assembly protein LptD [Pseudomonadota bacterium]
MKAPILIVLCNICFYSIGFTQCQENEEKAMSQMCVTDSGLESTTIDALYFLPTVDGVLKVGGDVCISMGKQSLQTKELFYNDITQQVSIQSLLTYSDGIQTIEAQSATVDISKETANLSNIYYKINDTNVNGQAKNLRTDEEISYLSNLTYSTCPREDQQWYIQAQTADLNQEKGVGTFRKMTLRFKGVPILYLPYAKMPLSDQRQSGFLIPEIANSSLSGFEFALPYYINISPNSDATIVPRKITKRGTMISGQFRYLGENYAGEFQASYLPSDNIFKDENFPDILKDDRHFIELKHRQSFGTNWLLSSKYSNISDNQYFEDFGDNIYATSKPYLYSFLKLRGVGNNWVFKGQLNDYQITSDSLSSNLNRQPYQSLPNLEYSWFNNYASTLNYGLDSEWNSLNREDSITANRLDFTPYIEKSFQNSYSRFTPKLAYRYTNWDYSNTEFSTIDQLEPSRSLPILSLDYTLNLEKQFSDGRFSSIEPRFFYLYVPYENQQNIPLFDTHGLTFGSGLLYQTNAFSGTDRQSDANQMSIGVTQRHFDQSGNEKWNITLGQIVYFADRRVQLSDSVETRSTSPIVSEINYIYDNWKATVSVHWDTQSNQSERALLKFQHKGKNNSLFNFAYRFRQGKIEQLDSSVVLPIGANNRIIARWNYSMDERKTIEAIAGFERKSCCWATRIVGRRYVFNEKGDVNNGIFFELQLNGLGSIGRKPRRLLKQSILGYSEEF